MPMVVNRPTPAGVMNQLLRLEQEYQKNLTLDCNITRRLASFVGSTIESYQKLDRAMDRARQYIQLQDKAGGAVCSGRVILADRMDAAKGRFRRVWHAPEGGVWGCLLHANTLLPSSRQFLPFAVGVACCETMQEYGLEGATVRWVNDVLVADRKIAGFLIESYTSKLTGEEYNLIGFGVNVNNSKFPDELSAIATSLSDCLGYEVELTEFSEKFIARLAWNIALVYQEEEAFLREESYSGKDGKHLNLEKFLLLSDSLGKQVMY
ncbi:MAG TPA: biotin--[acetyl-CoA-carboxylase] ligase, partial [Candidatus Atribacteria bacterium]|nr:biotin--[acetyl-CoA-carboxylase] ligase [Candidatus Atribacteria bacterium]